MFKYGFLAMTAVTVVLAGMVLAGRYRVNDLQDKLALAEARVVTCTARVANLMEDKRSDEIGDNLDLSDRDSLPSWWFLPESTPN